MRLTRLLAPAAAFLVLIATIAFRPSAVSPESWARGEVARIRAHFDSVLVELNARDVGALNGTQRARRSHLIATLAGYRDQGVFPHNYDFPEAPTPYFVDRKTGTRCAVAYLLESTGRGDIVRRVALANNNVWVAQLAGDTALANWLDANGLTLEEAARIQIPYMDAPAGEAQPSSVSTSFNVVAPLTVASTVVMGIWNATSNRDGHKRVGNILGVTTGALSTGLGVGLLMQRDAPRATGGVIAALGGISLMLASHAIYHHAGVMHAQRDAERLLARPQVSMAPFVTEDGGAGVGMTISF